jgi:putative DNA primase/helicase
LLWAIDGWRRLRARGRFEPPAASVELAQQMADLASPIGAWIRERCVTDEPDRDYWIRCEDAYADFKAWCAENGQQHVPTLTMFGRDIDTVTCCRRVRLAAKFPGGPRPWVYSGLRIRTEQEDEK